MIEIDNSYPKIVCNECFAESCFTSISYEATIDMLENKGWKRIKSNLGGDIHYCPGCLKGSLYGKEEATYPL